MKLIPVLSILCCAVALPAMAQPAPDAAKPTSYTLKLRLEQDGKDTLTQEIRILDKIAFDVATAVGNEYFSVRGTDEVKGEDVVVHLTYELTRTVGGATARSALNTTVLTKPDGQEVKTGWLSTTANNDIIWVSVRKAG